MIKDSSNIGEIKLKRYDKPKVSVIVPVFKVEKYLVQCIESIINQTMKEIEILIIDEGLEDRCREIIDYYESIDPRIIAPHQKNGGYGASVNLGIKMAKGEYISIIESDDYIEPEMYEEMYAYAQKLNADVVKSPYYEFYEDGHKRDCSYRRYMAEKTPSNACFSMKEFGEMLAIHASLWSGLYKKDYLKNNNIEFICAKGGAYVDVGFRIDTLIHTDKIAWIDKPYYNYRVDSIGSTTNNFKLMPMINRWKEAHDKFKDIQKDYENYYGKFLVLDEYLNTVGWLKVMEFTDEEFNAIYENLKFIPDKTIIDSPVLNKEQINDLLIIKNNPAIFKRKCKSHKNFNKFRNILTEFLKRRINSRYVYIPFLTFIVCILGQNRYNEIISNIMKLVGHISLVIISLYLINFSVYHIVRYIVLLYRRLKKKY